MSAEKKETEVRYDYYDLYKFTFNMVSGKEINIDVMGAVPNRPLKSDDSNIYGDPMHVISIEDIVSFSKIKGNCGLIIITKNIESYYVETIPEYYKQKVRTEYWTHFTDPKKWYEHKRLGYASKEIYEEVEINYERE